MGIPMSLIDSPDHPVRGRYGRRLHELRADVLQMGGLVDASIGRASQALATRDVTLAEAVIAGDAHINGLHHEVRALAFSLLLTEGPLAGDLREVIALLHMAVELERIGDHAVSVAKQARVLASLPPLSPPVDVGTLAGYCVEQVRDGLSAVVARDADRARAVAVRYDRLDRVYHRIHDELVERMQDDPASVLAAVCLISVAHHLERIGDRVTNLAEGLVFLESGEFVELG
jgi:phosphate transport system protein